MSKAMTALEFVRQFQRFETVKFKEDESWTDDQAEDAIVTVNRMIAEARKIRAPKADTSVLLHVVEHYKTGGGKGQWWEPIASFDVARVARVYASNAKFGQPAERYRVVNLKTGRKQETV